MAIQWGKADPHANTRLFLCLSPYRLPGFLRNSLKLRRIFATIGLEFHWSASGKVLRRAEMPFMKSNAKCEYN